MTTPDLCTRLDVTLGPDPRRVIVKLFVPGEDGAQVHSRASALVERVASLDDDEAGWLLSRTLQRFGDRHHDLETTFQHHYDLVRHRVARGSDLSPTARLLVGAYFSHEYAVEAAALCNPSMVAHPDQRDLADDQLRVAISLRQIGEGHLSSIGFATAVLGPDTQLRVADRPGPLMTGHRTSVRHRRDLLAAGLAEQGWDTEASAIVLNAVADRFDDDLARAVGALPADLLTRPTTQEALEQVRRTTAASYAADFPTEVPLQQRVLWPATPPESNGREDVRFVQFTGDGETEYRATYTAYDGRHIAGRLLRTTDFQHFEVTPLRGSSADNKGMALFPRRVAGRQLALSRFATTDSATSGQYL